MLATTVFNSCKKEELKSTGNVAKSNNSLQKDEQIAEITNFTYYDQDSVIIDSTDIDSTLDYVLLATITDDTSANVIYFENEDDAYVYVDSRPQYSIVKEKIEFTRDARSLAIANNVDLESVQTPPQVVLDFIDSWTSPLAKTTGVGQLFEHFIAPISSGGTGPYGSTTPITGFPRWGLGSFNDKASAAVLLGSAFLCEHSWWRGKRVIVMSITPSKEYAIALTPQWGLNFNDKTSSIF